MNPTAEQVHEVYKKRQEKILELKAELQVFETRQIEAEKYILEHNPGVETVASLYIGRRNECAALEKEQKEIKERQEIFEAWFAKRMREVGTEAFKTACGTIYSFRAESVSVADWETFVEQNLLAPASQALFSYLDENDITPPPGDLLIPETLMEILKTALPLYLLNRAVNKTAALEQMGDYDEKKKCRPNPALAGVDYRAVMKVGVRKS